MRATAARLVAAILSIGSASSEEVRNAASVIDVFSSRMVHTAGMDFKGGPGGEVDFTSASFLALLGKVNLPNDWVWVPAFRYQFGRLQLDADPFGGAAGAPELENDLHRATLHQILIRSPETSRWLQAAYLGTGITTDSANLGSNDVNLAAGFGATYRFNKEFTAGLGVFGANLLHDPFIVPAPVFFWTPDEQWLVTYFGPRMVVRRELGDSRRLGFEAGWNGGWWGVESFGRDARLQVSSFRAGIYYHHRISTHGWLEVGAGYTFANEIDVFSNGGRDLSPGLMGDAEPAPYIMAGFRLHRW